MKLNDYVVKSNLEEVAHSSGYAKAQSGRRFGAASTQSFSQRQAVDYRKSRIRSYGDSKLGQLRMAQKTKMESSMTALDQIRQKRIERENNDYMFNSNRQKNTVTGDQIDRATRMRMEARGMDSENRFDNVSQSGMAGFYGSSGISQSTQNIAKNFQPEIKPKF